MDDLERRVTERTWELESEVQARREAEEALKKEKESLEQALNNVKTLSGMLPICSNCKKIRDDLSAT